MSAHFNALTGQFLLSEQLIPAGSGQHYDLQNGGIVFSDLLVPKLGGTLFDDATLDINFAENKSLTDSVSGNNLITFTRASSGTYVDSDGLIQSAAVDTPRFDHDPSTGESLGLLIEEARTNLLTESEDVSSGYGLKSVTVPFDSSAVNPTGSLGSYKILADSGFSTGGVRITKSTTSSNNIVVSAFVKKSTYRYVLVGFGGIDNHFTALFDIEPGLTSNRLLGQDIKGSSSTIISAGYQDFPNDWIRIWAVGTTIGGGGPTVGMSEDASTFVIRNWTPAGTEEIYVWGLQYENNKTFPTSYIPTSGATVTRAADVATIDNSGSSVFNVDQFTTINKPFGRSSGSTTLTLLPADPASIQRVSVFNQHLSQGSINSASDAEDDGFWRWRIFASTFRLLDFTTDGQVTVDWGDGTVETLTNAVHTFANGLGYYEVGFRLDSGTYFQPYINNNTTHKDKVVAIGPAPVSMTLHAFRAFNGCASLEAFDATVDTTGGVNFTQSWRNCSSLASFPFIDTSGGTNFNSAWSLCSSLTNFPLLDTSSGTSFNATWRNCSNLTSFPLIDTSGGSDFQFAWDNCSSLTSFPLIDTSSGIEFDSAWEDCSNLTSFPLLDTSSGSAFNAAWRGCSNLASFPLIDTSGGTNFANAWNGCSSLTSFPLIDTSGGTNFSSTWYGCGNLTSFPLIDTSSGTTFNATWRLCSSLTSFPLIDTSGGSNFQSAWYQCTSLTSFPAIDTSSGTIFRNAWRDCSSLTSFPANFFDSWTGTPVNNCFVDAWDGCSSLTATSVENILNSIDTSGQSAPGSGKTITIDYDTGTGTPSVATAVTNLKSRGWAITLNGVAQ